MKPAQLSRHVTLSGKLTRSWSLSCLRRTVCGEGKKCGEKKVKGLKTPTGDEGSLHPVLSPALCVLETGNEGHHSSPSAFFQCRSSSRCLQEPFPQSSRHLRLLCPKSTFHRIATVWTSFSASLDQRRSSDPLCFGQQTVRLIY